MGRSFGAEIAPIYLGLETRIRAGILLGGGLEIWANTRLGNPIPEYDVLNFAFRVHQPILMVNGKDDVFFPYRESQLALFHRFGVSEPDKRHLVFHDAGHFYFYGLHINTIERTTIEWLDEHLGPVQ